MTNIDGKPAYIVELFNDSSCNWEKHFYYKTHREALEKFNLKIPYCSVRITFNNKLINISLGGKIERKHANGKS